VKWTRALHGRRPGPLLAGPGLKISFRNWARPGQVVTGPGRAGLRRPGELKSVRFAYYGAVKIWSSGL